MTLSSAHLRYRRILFALLATTGTMGVFLFSMILFSRYPQPLYAQTPAPSAATLVLRSLEDAITPGDPVCAETCTLRDAIRTANELAGPDTIVFAEGLAGEITLVAELTLNGDVTITGPGSERLTITVPGSNFNRRTVRVSPTANITPARHDATTHGHGKRGRYRKYGQVNARRCGDCQRELQRHRRRDLQLGSPHPPRLPNQRGQPRPADGNDGGVAACDIGAFEAQSAPEPPAPVEAHEIFLPYIQLGEAGA
jgi:hypothetical protein